MFPERSSYTFVYNGQMTLAGQRSSTVAELIVSTGAVNQLKPDITELMLGGGASSKAALEKHDKDRKVMQLPKDTEDQVSISKMQF